MPAMIRQVLEQLAALWKGPGRMRLVFGGLGIVAGLLLLSGVFWWASQPDWAPLYSGLDEIEAARVVDQLEQQGVSYRLVAGGRTVEVPRTDLYRLRVKLAAEGGPKRTVPGYEILDEQRLGLSDRELDMMQKRALEGELARTLSALDWVESATVHVVRPKPSLFSDEQLPTTASVTLVTDPRRTVPKAEVASVVALVAGAVEGLHPSRVTVVSSGGRLLSEPMEDDALFGRSSRQIELARKVDGYLSSSAQNVLDQVLGSGRSVVRVSAELDFSYLERTSRVFDPEKRIVRSQELNEESRTGADTSATQGERQITNFEVNEILEHSRGEQGAIRRLSVSLVVDGTYAPADGEDQGLSYLPRSPEEMAKLTEVVKSAVGFDEQRGDQVFAHNLPFDTSMREEDLGGMRRQKIQDMVLDGLRKALFVGGIVAFLLLLRSTLSRINLRIGQAFDDKRALLLAAAKGEPEDIEEEMPLMLEVEAARSPEQRQLLKVHRKVSDYCMEHPEDAARLVRAWVNG
jgi:flagellar M-ring protein FliF